MGTNERTAALRAQAAQTAAASAEPGRRKHGLALCLSGGGYRAALFHLGAMRRLDETGAIAQVETVTSVSGGSIMAAFLADRLARRYGPTGVPQGTAGPIFSDWQRDVAGPFRDFCRRDIRTGTLLERLKPANWFRSQTSVLALAALYEKYLTRLRLAELPERPRFVLCATDMVFGVNWIFERQRMGSWQAGYARPPLDWPLARSVAASSCFPPLFPPLPLTRVADLLRHGAYREKDRNAILRQLGLTDGGVYDNLGLEPVWKDHAVVLASDGGGRLGFSWSTNPLSTVSRYAAIVQSQAGAVRTRWLSASYASGVFRGAYWGIAGTSSGSGDRTKPPGLPGYSRDLALRTIATVRTDLDRFTATEAAVLENHGYCMAAAAIEQHMPELVAMAPPPAVPYPEWMDAARVTDGLRDSGRRFSWRRWFGG